MILTISETIFKQSKFIVILVNIICCLRNTLNKICFWIKRIQNQAISLEKITTIERNVKKLYTENGFPYINPSICLSPLTQYTIHNTHQL